VGDRGQILDKALQALRDRDLDPQSAGGAVALEFLLGTKEAAPTASAAAVPQPAPTPSGSSESANAEEPITALANWSGIDTARLSDFFEFSDEIRLTISPARLPKSKADQQRILSLLTLAADRIGNGAQQTGWSQINAVVDDYAVLDQNLGNNVAKHSSLVIRSGKPKTYVYRITQPGLERARELIQALASGDEVLSS
jgi:hypothetical protein